MRGGKPEVVVKVLLCALFSMTVPQRMMGLLHRLSPGADGQPPMQRPGGAHARRPHNQITCNGRHHDYGRGWVRSESSQVRWTSFPLLITPYCFSRSDP